MPPPEAGEPQMDSYEDLPPSKEALIASLESPTDTPSNEESCTICGEPYDSEAHKPVVLKCHHTYGRSCLLEWLDHARTCPLCRCDLHRGRVTRARRVQHPYMDQLTELTQQIDDSRTEVEDLWDSYDDRLERAELRRQLRGLSTEPGSDMSDAVSAVQHAMEIAHVLFQEATTREEECLQHIHWAAEFFVGSVRDSEPYDEDEVERRLLGGVVETYDRAVAQRNSQMDCLRRAQDLMIPLYDGDYILPLDDEISSLSVDPELGRR